VGPRRIRYETRMKSPAVCSWSLRPESPEALADAVRRCGLDAVQLALVPCVEDPAWADGVARLRALGIRIVSGMLATVGEDYSTLASIAATGGVRPDATWPATWERAQRVAERAGAEGIGLVTFHAGFLPHEPGDPERTRMVGRLRQVADAFARHGVDVAFETGQESAPTLLGALEEIAHPNVGVNFDPANMILYGMGDPVAAIAMLAPHVRQVHVKDALPAGRAGEWGREVPVGQGAVPWEAFLAEVARLPARVDLVIEREAGPTREADVRAAAERVTRAGAALLP